MQLMQALRGETIRTEASGLGAEGAGACPSFRSSAQRVGVTKRGDSSESLCNHPCAMMSTTKINPQMMSTDVHGCPVVFRG